MVVFDVYMKRGILWGSKFALNGGKIKVNYFTKQNLLRSKQAELRFSKNKFRFATEIFKVVFIGQL